MPSRSPAPAPWLSILIPAYNVAPYIEDCLESILSQVDVGVEVIVTDDCSTDHTPSLAREFVDARPGRSVTLLYNERNCGLSGTRNRMLETCTGEYVWFVDADDRIRPGSVERLKAIVEAHAPDLVICDFADYHGGDDDSFAHPEHKPAFIGASRQIMTDRDALLKGLFESGRMHSWSKIAKRSVWGDTLRFPEGRYFEDVATTPLLALRTRTYYYEPSAWIDYRKAEGSILATMSARKCLDLMHSMIEVTAELRRLGPGLPDTVLFPFNKFCTRRTIGCLKTLLRDCDDTDRSMFLANILRLAEKLLQSERRMTHLNFSISNLLLRFRLEKWKFRARRVAR